MKKKPVSAPAAASTFAGFPDPEGRFWKELKKEMNKPWYEKNKARYQAEWVTPMDQLLAEFSDAVAKNRLAALGDPKIMRIHRDVRFSKDKAPYRDHMGAMVPFADGTEGSCGGVHLQVGPITRAGTGVYEFGSKETEAWRASLATSRGAKFADLVAELEGAGFTLEAHNEYKKVPAGLGEDHPRARFLKMRGVGANFPDPPKGALKSRALLDWMIESMTQARPFLTWLDRNVLRA